MLYFYQALVSLSVSKGKMQNLIRQKCEPLKNSVIFPRSGAVDSKVLVGVLCSVCAQLCRGTALGPTTVCNLPLGVSISIWHVDSVCIYSELSSLGLPGFQYCMDSCVPS